jgi:negative regulator of sigma E activity
MTVMILAHGGHVAMVIMPVAAVIYLVVALKGETPKKKSASTPVLPTNQFGREVHHAMSPPKKATTPPVPAQFTPGRAEKKRARGNVVPLRAAPSADHRPDPSFLPSARNQ